MLDKTVTFGSADWKYIKQKLDEQLKNARDILENKQTTPDDTAFYRGRVSLAKELLHLPEILETLSREKGNQ